MNKIPRFMKEYANYQIGVLDEICMTTDKKDTSKEKSKVNKTLRLYEAGLITVSEAMKNINECMEV